MGKENNKKGQEETVKATPETTTTEQAIEVQGEAKADKSQISWGKLGDKAIAYFPSGKQLYFDITKFDAVIARFYGVKQLISDKAASAKTEEEKVQMMKDFYSDVVAFGLELSPTGKVGIIGKIRANAVTAKVELTKANSMIELLMKQVAGTITEDEKKVLAGLIEAKSKIEKNA